MCVKQQRTSTAVSAAAPPAATTTAVAAPAAPHGASAAEASKSSSPSPSRLSSDSERFVEPFGSPHASATLPHLHADKIAVANSAAIDNVSNNQLELEQLCRLYDAADIDIDIDNNNNDSSDAMGQCYPKCMNEYVDDSGRILPGMRTTRSNKPRHSLGNMKSQSPTDDALADVDALDTVAHAIATLDLEELGSESIVTTLLPAAPTSIVVDYEDALESDSEQQQQQQSQSQSRRGSISDCVHDACGPLGSAFAQQPAAESDNGLPDRKSAPVTPSRRRSRKDSLSIGDTTANTVTAVTPRRHKALVSPESPTTDTDASDNDETDARCTSVPKLCLCEVKRHKTRDSCWLVVGKLIYDVTGIVDVHPGGARSILRKAGGPDCTQDMKFHTKNARRMLEQCFIGKLQPCGDVVERQDSNCSIM